ncbi:hypothetical protein AT728_07435 [Streptomyces silvensis]|uniref:Uncharacterized protein n=1 Tax=Streptomyces silvensis TaxID=1765722 RepID=A0A0W7X7B7_9ACTN|nr:hypothetical protein AT728_07435 [Streptomyces silvensis]
MVPDPLCHTLSLVAGQACAVVHLRDDVTVGARITTVVVMVVAESDTDRGQVLYEGDLYTLNPLVLPRVRRTPCRQKLFPLVEDVFKLQDVSLTGLGCESAGVHLCTIPLRDFLARHV